jgi:hypothetical protein
MYAFLSPIIKKTLPRKESLAQGVSPPSAVCYAELDQLEDARAEGAEMLRLSPAFGLTGFERYWPMKDPAVVKRTLAALCKAGLK